MSGVCECVCVSARARARGRMRDRVRCHALVITLIRLCIVVMLHVQRFEPHTCIVIEGIRRIKNAHNKHPSTCDLIVRVTGAVVTTAVGHLNLFSLICNCWWIVYVLRKKHMGQT